MKIVFKTITLGLATIVFGLTIAVATAHFVTEKTFKVYQVDNSNEQQHSFISKAVFNTNSNREHIDLTYAAEKTVHAVVHIKSTQNSKTRTVRRMPDIYDFFFGDGMGREETVRTKPSVGFGSGVILSKDGYIVTNNHVIDNADEITVTLNDNRTLPARLVGKDENTDLALIKVDCDDLEFLTVGDSDALKVGEWVLAVGNPFNLTSTVTAGIVSAKARSLGVYNGGIESFIQTDAAINQGNSGGALVNANGELVGINAVLSSPTGSYAGYGFAIPVSIMTKVVSDLKEFGTVQRAVLGIVGGTVTSELDKEKDLGTIHGVYVSETTPGSAAAEAGIKSGDVITGIDSKTIKSIAELQETLAKYLPGNEVNVKIIRDKKEKEVKVKLKNIQGNTNVVKNVDIEILGAELQPISNTDKERYNIPYGLKVTSISKGLFKDAGINKDFIIVKVNGVAMKNIEELDKIIKEANASSEPVLFVVGITPSGRKAYFSIELV